MVYLWVQSENRHRWAVLTGEKVPEIGSRHRVHADCGPTEERIVLSTRPDKDCFGNDVTVIDCRTELFTSERWAEQLRRERPDATVIVCG